MSYKTRKNGFALYTAILSITVATFFGAILAAFGSVRPAHAETSFTYTPTIYWGLKEVTVDYVQGYELILSSQDDITETEKGSFSGDTDYSANGSLVPWKQLPNSNGKPILTVTIKNEIAPMYTACWFSATGSFSSQFKTIDLKNLDMSGVLDMQSMFSGTGLTSFDFTGLKLPDPANFEKGQKLDMSGMFADTQIITVNMSAIKILIHDDQYTGMFNNCSKLETVVAPNYSDIYYTQEYEDYFNSSYEGKPEIKLPSIKGQYYNGTEYTNKITMADKGKTFTLHKCDKSNLVKVEMREATCSQEGITQAHWTCGDCGRKYGDADGNTLITADITTPKTAHTEVNIPAVAATCTTAGSSAGKKCSVCDTVTQEQTAIAALGHDYGEWTVYKAATQEEDGEERRYCSRDESHYESRTVSKLAADPANPSKPSDKPDTSDTTDPSNPAEPSDTTDTVKPSNPSDPAKSKGLSNGAIVGISVSGSVVLLLLIYVLLYFLPYKKGSLKGKFWNVIYTPMNAMFNKKKDGDNE